jgi:glycosyltransferase involved in cell wall biosynthesis
MTASPRTPTPTPAAARPAKVWVLQPTIEHYRTPIFDGLVERGRADHAYTLEVLGGMKDGKAIGGSARPYFREVPRETFKKFGLTLFRWPLAPGLIREGRPDLLVMEANIRNRTCWDLLKQCRAAGTPVVGWSKVHSYSHSGPLMNFLKRRFYGKFDRMICYGESSKAELVSLGYPADRAIIANNTIDTRRIFAEGDALRARGAAIRRERGLDGRKIMLCIGRMDPDKRHQDLLDAWPRLRALDPTLTLVLISGGPLLEEIRAKAAALDPAGILVTGRVPEGDDYAWIATSDVCVYPGAVGLAINQSLAFGRPTLIANERGADSEILVGGEDPAAQTGWRYERGNLDALTAGVRAILAGGPAVEAVCTRAMTLMRDKVTLENMIGAIDRSIRLGLAMRK